MPLRRHVGAGEVHEALRRLQILLHTHRLYHHAHPKCLESLDTTYDSLQDITLALNGLEIRVERENLVVPKLSEAPVPDGKGELRTLAMDLQAAGVQTLVFLRQFHVGELDTLSQLLRASLLKSGESNKRQRDSWWTAKLLEFGVEGIRVNAQTDRRVDTVLASLIAALVAFGGNSPTEDLDTAIAAPSLESLSAVLRLVSRLTPPLESARGLAPDEAARAIHAALSEANRDTVHLLLSAISQHAPKEAEKPQPYLIRLSEQIILEFLSAEFSYGAIAPREVAKTLQLLADVLVSSGGYSGPHSSQHLSSLAALWADEAHREKLIERFWASLPPREKSAVLRGQDVWCVPVSAIRQNLAQLADAGADAPRREARNILLNYARRLEMPEAGARRSVSAGLNELSGVIESLWPNQLPEELNRCTLKALESENQPETAALLSAFLDTLCRIALTRGDFAALEGILLGLERPPREPQFEHMHALAHRLIAQDRWLLLVDAALANRALDPALPRLLVRDPERLLDRLTLLLTEPRAQELLPPMARLLRTIGVPVLNLLETRLYEARKQRVSAAIKLLATADPERLLRGLPRALSSWEWNLQDLAVSELSRPANATSAHSAAFVFSTILSDAHPLVVPMMVDHIGLAQETTAAPQLMEIAAGAHEQLRDQYVRIKAIEALARMRATEAADILRTITDKRDGLAYAEPAGLRSVAADALALLEDRPAAAQVRAAYETAPQAGSTFVVPRRYTRVPLESPLRAQIEGGAPVMARVKTISLGGAYLESPRKLNVGDTIQLEVRSGLRKIHFTAVVRNAGPDGNGVEFLHMKGDDRDKLRKLVQRHL
ncbi:MAG TPA: PilZ domain-containing protein [Dongiaceae bacterium]|nr:PilZ domain-containing protein [Dongiaceae bacterium]